MDFHISQDSLSRRSDTINEDVMKTDLEYSERPRNTASDDDTASGSIDLSSTWTESTNVPKRRMGMIQVASLVINQCMGSGILSLPAGVLLSTGSKPMAIGLWVIAGVYTFITGIMFVEYSSAFPFTGGPLIWLDEIFYTPAMLAANIFAWYWNLLATTGNVQGTASAILSLVWPDIPSTEFSEGLLRLVSVFVLTVICILLYVARRACFMLNSAFALFKVILVVVVFVSGLVSGAKDPATTGLSDFNVHHVNEGGLAKVGALIYIAWTYEGWEHTNYIAGEIKLQQQPLRKGVFSGILIVMVMYTVALVGLYSALTYDEIVSPIDPMNVSIGYSFANKVFGTTRGMSVVMMLSSGSCAFALTYTQAKVRQAIAWQRLVPFYKFIGMQDTRFDSPGGALFMHWLFSVLQIAATKGKTDAHGFWAYLYIYSYQIELAVLAIGLLWLTKRKRESIPDWKFQNIPNKFVLALLVALIFGLSMFVLITVAMANTGHIHNYWMAVTIFSILLAAVIHWGVLRLLSTEKGGETIGQRFLGLEVQIHTCGDDDESEHSDSLKALMLAARADGTRRRIEYQLHGRLKWFVESTMDRLERIASFLD